MNKRTRHALWLAGVLLLSLIVFLAELGERGIWQDEGLTLYQVRLPFGEILANRIPVAQFITQNTVPPLYFLVLGAWGRLAGFGIWGLRLFSVAAVLLALALFFDAGRAMGGARVGRLAALLGALSPLYLWYAQELRMYTFLLALATLSFALLWRWHREAQHPAGPAPWRWIGGYVLVAAAMGWTHYLALPLVAAQLAWLALMALRRRTLPLLLGLVALLALLVPLIPFGTERLLAGAERDFAFQPLGFIVTNALHAFAFGLPWFQSDPAHVLPLLPLAWGLLAVGLWGAWRRGGWPLLLLLGAGLTLPVLLIYLLSYVKPLYQNARHLIAISPAFYLLWALALDTLAERRRWLPLLVVPWLAYGWLPAYGHYFHSDEALKNDVRPLFEYLRDVYVPGDVVALNDPVLQHALTYFAPGVPWTVLPLYGEPLNEADAVWLYGQVAQQYERIWYVFGPPDTTFNTWQHVWDWFSDPSR